MTFRWVRYLNLRGQVLRRSDSYGPLRELRLFSAGSLIRLGSFRGGWAVKETPDLEGCRFLSLGAGDNISFDVELAAIYGASGVLMDPTPIAIKHFQSVMNRVGSRRESGYRETESQHPGSYDLSQISAGQLQLIPKAIWSTDGQVHFYPPGDQGTISYSVDQKMKYADSSPSPIQVDSVSPSTLSTQIGQDFYLIKMDIEGAEIEVLSECLETFTGVKQLLIEFDAGKLARPDRDIRLKAALAKIELCDFVPVHRNKANILFLKRELLA